ncbi:MAG TPA: hypothetical protein VFK97_00370, partial [Candidatus Saccharimonadales bacterium]|nr:hypothetical protein [Candidatus Saccharimonadales bacterium]
GVIAVFSEVAPLVYMRDMPDAELTPASAAELTANSYDFIQRILNAGGRVGAALAHAYVVSKSPEDAHSGFGGTIRANRLAEPDRLARFGLVADAQPARVEAIDIDEFTNVWNSEAVELGLENKVNCPAEIYKDPDTSERFARRIFKIMLGYTEAHIYPRYLPIVRGVLEQERSRELARENT